MSDCIFCKIASGQIPTNYIYEDEKVVAITKISSDVDKEIQDNISKETSKNDSSLEKLVERAMSEIEDTDSEE